MNREVQKEMTRDKIIQNATSVFGDFSYDKASINMICKKAELSKGIVYHHFKDKDELYCYCVLDSIKHYLAYMDDKIIFNDDFEKDFEAFFNIRQTYFRMDDAHSKLYQRALYNTPLHLKEIFKEQHRIVVTYNTALLQRMIKAVDLPVGVDSDDVIEYFGIVLDGFQNSLSSKKSTQDHDDKIRQIMKFIYYGILRR